MAHELLGKWITCEGSDLKIEFLRADCDAGIGTAYKERGLPEYLVRLSSKSIIRPIQKGEDFDRAVLAARP